MQVTGQAFRSDNCDVNLEQALLCQELPSRALHKISRAEALHAMCELYPVLV
jgi:hypothetical protein